MTLYKYAIGIDVGGTEIKYGVVKEYNNKFSIECHFSLPTPYGKNRVIQTVKIIGKIVKDLSIKYPSVTSVGIGIAGLINIKKGEVILAPNLEWQNVPLKKLLLKEIRLPIVIENDANIAAMGIYKYELKEKYKTLVCFTLGTGIGGGIIINGKIFHGSIGTAGELGHITLFPQGRKCSCGNYGCIERYLGSKWFISDVIKRLKISKVKSKIYDLTDKNLNNLTPYLLYLAAEKNDSFAKQLWEIYGKYLGIIVTDIINILNPEIIVFSGGISAARKYFFSSLKKEVLSRTQRICSYQKGINVKYHFSSSPKNLGIIGAGIVALESSACK